MLEQGDSMRRRRKQLVEVSSAVRAGQSQKEQNGHTKNGEKSRRDECWEKLGSGAQVIVFENSLNCQIKFYLQLLFLPIELSQKLRWYCKFKLKKSC